MKNTVLLGLAIVLMSAILVRAADEMPKMPDPVKEHAWLQQLVGEWDSDCEMTMEPGKPPMKTKGTESVRAVGGYWVVAENRGTMMDKPYTGVLTLGYDPEKKKYVGTWIDSMTSLLWTYDGRVDSAGNVLTLETEAPCPMLGGKIVKVKEVLEIKGKDQKVFTSSMEMEPGKWTTMVTINYRRKS